MLIYGTPYASLHRVAWYNNTYIKATSENVPGAGFDAFLTCNPALSLVGDWTGQQWLGNITNQRFHIDYAYPVLPARIYYENSHATGTVTNTGAKNFTFWGSNSAAAFADLTYGDDANWIQLPVSQTTFDQHIASNQADPKYITIINPTILYRYYAFKFADNWGHGSYLGVRRIELQIGTIL